MKITIIHHSTGETIPLSRDVRVTHPAWVHEQCETASESELQAVLDCYDQSAAGAGPDVSGIEITAEDVA